MDLPICREHQRRIVRADGAEKAKAFIPSLFNPREKGTRKGDSSRRFNEKSAHFRSVSRPLSLPNGPNPPPPSPIRILDLCTRACRIDCNGSAGRRRLWGLLAARQGNCKRLLGNFPLQYYPYETISSWSFVLSPVLRHECSVTFPVLETITNESGWLGGKRKDGSGENARRWTERREESSIPRRWSRATERG